MPALLAVDAKAQAITVTEAIPGSSTADEQEAGTSRGTAGAIADRHTIAVDPSVADSLSRLEPGQVGAHHCPAGSRERWMRAPRRVFLLRSRRGRPSPSAWKGVHP